MATTKKILIALDASERANVVLDEGLKLAAALKAKVVLFRAIASLKDLPVPLPVPTAPLQLQMTTEGERDLKQLAARVPAGLLEAAVVEEGSAWRAICHAASRLAVDVIVIGAYSQTGVERLLGSTAGRVANHAPCSVLVVRTPAPS